MSKGLRNLAVPGKIFSLEALFPDSNPDKPFPVLKATSDPDTMYYYKSLKETGS
jgi:hypothetical protein